MSILSIYEIVNTVSGQELGGYEAESEEQALDAMAQDAGYTNWAAACAVSPVKPGEIKVTLHSAVVAS